MPHIVTLVAAREATPLRPATIAGVRDAVRGGTAASGQMPDPAMPQRQEMLDGQPAPGVVVVGHHIGVRDRSGAPTGDHCRTMPVEQPTVGVAGDDQALLVGQPADQAPQLQEVPAGEDAEVRRHHRQLAVAGREPGDGRDARLVRRGELDFDAFVAAYGHLRPGTYDTTSPCYRAAGEAYLRPVVDAADDDGAADAIPVRWSDATRHAVAGALRVAEQLAAEKGPEATVLINLSGRGDKDMGTAIEYFGLGDPDKVTEDPVG